MDIDLWFAQVKIRVSFEIDHNIFYEIYDYNLHREWVKNGWGMPNYYHEATRTRDDSELDFIPF